jgi:hypothetical protein
MDKQRVKELAELLTKEINFLEEQKVPGVDFDNLSEIVDLLDRLAVRTDPFPGAHGKIVQISAGRDEVDGFESLYALTEHGTVLNGWWTKPARGPAKWTWRVIEGPGEDFSG